MGSDEGGVLNQEQLRTQLLAVKDDITERRLEDNDRLLSAFLSQSWPTLGTQNG